VPCTDGHDDTLGHVDGGVGCWTCGWAEAGKATGLT
jgi:hypothetical protein